MQKASRARAAIATVALGAAGVVVAIAARWPLSGATRVDAQSAQAPTSAVVVLLLGAGLVMLAAVVMLVLSGRRRKDDPDELEPPPFEVPWWLKLIAVLLPFALGAALVAAAVSGSRRTRNPAGIGLGGFGAGGLGGAPTRAASAASGFVVPSWLPWTLLGIVAFALAVGVVVTLLRRHQSSDEVADASATRAAVEAAIEALDAEGDARRAVIAAYGAMQRTLAEHGIARSPEEAPREYLERVLVASHATEEQATTLTGLFEEARYSAHAISEQLRVAALSALRSLRSRLQAEPQQ
jgi:Domain of unknown function (DUF4129)